MADQKGFLYEAAIHTKLKNKGLVPLGFQPAKSDPNKPDGKFIYKGETYNLEVKLNMKVDFGQGTLDYTSEGWVLGGVQEFKADGVTPRAGYAAAEKMRQLLRAIGTEEFANQKWGYKKAPNKIKIPNDSNFTQKMKDEDYKNYPSRFKPIDKQSIWDYYAVKSTYYIQIGGYGLYYMAANPANLPIPRFDVTSRLRIRMKPSQSYPVYSYGFKTAILVQSKPQRSTMDLDRRTDLDKLAA